VSIGIDLHEAGAMTVFEIANFERRVLHLLAGVKLRCKRPCCFDLTCVEPVYASRYGTIPLGASIGRRCQ
jgi:hypothetical protein